MTDNLWIAAQISLLGMSLVFGAILLLWVVLALLVRLTTERQPKPISPEATRLPELAIPDQSGVSARAALVRAAATAVATALALNSQGPDASGMISTPPSSAVSAWQAVMRATVLNARRPRR